MTENRNGARAVVIGISMGGVGTLRQLLCALPAEFPLPILVVQHLAPDSGDGLAQLLDEVCTIAVKEADEQEMPGSGTVYFAPPNYHLIVEPDGRLGLSVDPPVNYARPSVDVLFETASDAFGPGLIGIILTGAGNDGSRGSRRIKEKGGIVIIQDPADAVAPSMPEQALKAVEPDYLVTLEDLPRLLIRLAKGKDE